MTRSEKARSSLRGKGWVVKRFERRGLVRYSSYVYRDGKYHHRKSAETLLDAAHIAVAESARAGSIDWTRTKEWFDVAGLTLNMDDVETALVRPHGGGRYGRGWMVYRHKACGSMVHEAWEVFLGRKKSEKMYVGRSATKRGAVIKAIELSRQTDYFGERETEFWLRKNGFEDLIDSPLTARKTA